MKQYRVKWVHSYGRDERYTIWYSSKDAAARMQDILIKCGHRVTKIEER